MKNDNSLKIALYSLGMLIPDKWFIMLKYRKAFGRWPDLKNPKTFNEKLNWLKLNDHNPLYTTMVDKYEAKKYVANIIGDEYIIPTYGVWDRAEDIDFDSLPDKFVLKATHDSGRVIICKDKSKLDREYAISEMRKSLKRNFYAVTREWPYKNVKPRIIAEQLLTPESNGDLPDYKFFCFNGKVDCVMVCLDRHIRDTKFYFVNDIWAILPLNKRGLTLPADFTLPKPMGIERMFQLASTLSKGFAFLRVDLYNVDGKIYFGELTFYPDSGLDTNLLNSTDLYWGDLIPLENN